MLKLFCSITGDDYNLVRQDTPASKRKISALATVVLIPVSIWFLIGYSIASTILNLSIISALGIGAFTGSIILIIERVILMSGSSGWLLGLRLALGLLIAFLGAIFFDEIIFKEDIDQQFFHKQKELIELAKRKVNDEIGSEIETAKHKADAAYVEWIQSVNETQKESDGTGGSGIRGISNITKLKIAFSEKLEQDYQNAKKELDRLEIIKETNSKQAEEEIAKKITGNSIILRIKLLFKLVLSDRLVMIFYAAVSLFLFFLEFIVIIMKYSLNETSYEKRVKAQEIVAKRRLELIMDRDSKLFNPYENSAPVMSARNALDENTPGLFRSYSTQRKAS